MRSRGLRRTSKFTSPLTSARNDIRNLAFRVELHNRRFLDAIEKGDENLIEREALELFSAARKAGWAGNLVINNGRPVKQAIEEQEQLLIQKKLDLVSSKPETKIILALAKLVNDSERERRGSSLLEDMPHYGSPQARAAFERSRERWQGQKRCLVSAIAETDFDSEIIALIVQGAQYERAAGFINKHQDWIKEERERRITRERINAERGQEFCLFCGEESDGSYCDSYCLEQHLADAIEESGLRPDCYVAVYSS